MLVRCSHDTERPSAVTVQYQAELAASLCYMGEATPQRTHAVESGGKINPLTCYQRVRCRGWAGSRAASHAQESSAAAHTWWECRCRRRCRRCVAAQMLLCLVQSTADPPEGMPATQPIQDSHQLRTVALSVQIATSSAAVRRTWWCSRGEYHFATPCFKLGFRIKDDSPSTQPDKGPGAARRDAMTPVHHRPCDPDSVFFMGQVSHIDSPRRGARSRGCRGGVPSRATPSAAPAPAAALQTHAHTGASAYTTAYCTANCRSLHFSFNDYMLIWRHVSACCIGIVRAIGDSHDDVRWYRQLGAAGPSKVRQAKRAAGCRMPCCAQPRCRLRWCR